MPDLAKDVLRPERELDAAVPGAEVARLLVAGIDRGRRVGELVHDDVAGVRLIRAGRPGRRRAARPGAGRLGRPVRAASRPRTGRRPSSGRAAMTPRVWAAAAPAVADGPTDGAGDRRGRRRWPRRPQPATISAARDEPQRRCRTPARRAAHPGGQSNARPPIRWRWRWSTVWPPQRPTLLTIR